MVIKPTETTFCDYIEYNTDLDFTFAGQKWLYDYLDTKYNDDWIFDEEEIALCFCEYTKDDFIDRYFDDNVHIDKIVDNSNEFCTDDLVTILCDILQYNGKNVSELDNGNIMVVDLCEL